PLSSRPDRGVDAPARPVFPAGQGTDAPRSPRTPLSEPTPRSVRRALRANIHGVMSVPGSGNPCTKSEEKRNFFVDVMPPVTSDKHEIPSEARSCFCKPEAYCK